MTSALAAPDLKALTGQVAMLAEYFNYELEPHVLRLYVDGLRDVPPDALRMGCRRCILTQRFMPKVVEIREAIDAEAEERRRLEAYDTPPMREMVCTNCEDSGWVIVAERTDRAQPTARRCPCYQTNPRLVAPKHYATEECR